MAEGALLQAGDVDRARLEFVLRQLGFKCYVLVDGTAREIWSTLQVKQGRWKILCSTCYFCSQVFISVIDRIFFK